MSKETKSEVKKSYDIAYNKGWEDAVKSKNLTISILMKEIDELKRKYVPRELDKTGTS